MSTVESGGSATPSDLSAWVLVNVSHFDDENLFSCDVDDLISAGGAFVGERKPEFEPPREFVSPDDVISIRYASSSMALRYRWYRVDDESEGARAALEFVSPGDVISIQYVSPTTFLVGMTLGYHVRHVDGDDDDDDIDDDAVDDDDDDDDEMMTWKFKARFRRQRKRKLRKRGGPKPSKSKRMPNYYNRPECLFGKHEYGVQHLYI